MKISPFHLDRGQAHVGESRLSRVGGRTGTAAAGVDAGIDGGSRGGDGTVRRRLGRQPERAEQAPHGVGLGHRAPDPARAGTARSRISVTCQCQTPPNSTTRRRTSITRPRRKYVRLDRPECVGVRSRDHLLISRLKVRFLHGSPFGARGLEPLALLAFWPSDSAPQGLQVNPVQAPRKRPLLPLSTSRVVQPFHGCLVPHGEPPTIGVHRELDRGVPELPLDIR